MVSILARAEARALPQHADQVGRFRHVSILARAEARALRPRPARSGSWLVFQSSRAPRRARCRGPAAHGLMRLGFNPRARRGARVAAARRDEAAVGEVSILARAEARALQANSWSSLLLSKFQSSRAPRRARCRPWLQSVRPAVGFQSSRAPRRARCPRPAARLDAPRRFNPRARRGARVALFGPSRTSGA